MLTLQKERWEVFMAEKEVDEKSNMHFLHIAFSDKPVTYYSLDVIISVGYRVKSKRGIEFRKWANSVLKQYILKGYAANEHRLEELRQTLQIIRRTENQLDTNQILSVIEQYTAALDLLDDYDHLKVRKPEGTTATYRLTYEEARKVIDSMKFGDTSSLFGNEKDESFEGSFTKSLDLSKDQAICSALACISGLNINLRTGAWRENRRDKYQILF